MSDSMQTSQEKDNSDQNSNSRVWRLHWVIFLMPSLIFVLGIILKYQWFYYPLKILGLPVMLIGAIWALNSLFLYYFSSLLVTPRFITVQRGVLVRTSVTISMDKLESVDVVQNILGCMLNYGGLMVRGTGGSYLALNPIPNPLTCRRFIESTHLDVIDKK